SVLRSVSSLDLSSAMNIGLDPQIKNQINELKAKKSEIDAQLSGVHSEMVGSIQKSNTNAGIPIYDKKVKYAEKFIELAKSEYEIQERNKKLEEYGTEIGMSKGSMKDENTRLSKFGSQLSSIIDESKLVEEGVKKVDGAMSESIKKNQEFIANKSDNLNKIIADTNQKGIDLWFDTGKLTIGKETYKGIDALARIFKGSLDEEVNSLLRGKKSEIEATEATVANLKLGTQSEENKKALVDAEESLEMRKSELAIMKEKAKGELELNEMLGKSTAEKFKGYAINKKNATLMARIVQSERELANINPENVKEIETIKQNISYDYARLDFNEVAGKEKGRKSDYELKYTNIVKENLALESEMSKLLQSQGKQYMLNLSYKQKELDVNKKLILEEVNNARNLISSKGGSSEGIHTSKQGQQALDDMTKQYGSVTQSKDVKDRFQAIETLTKSLAKAEKNAMDSALIPLQTFQDTLKGMPSLVEEVYSSLQGLDVNALSKENKEYVDYLKKANLDNIDMVVKSWSDAKLDIPIDGLNKDNIDSTIMEYKGSVLNKEDEAKGILEKKETGAELTEMELYTLELYTQQAKVLEDLLLIKKGINKEEKNTQDITIANLATYNKLGGVLSKLGSATGLKPLGDLGSSISSVGDFGKSLEKNKVNFGDMVNFNDDWSKNFGKGMENAMAGIDMGSTIGSMIGSTTGGGASAQAGGAIGGLVAGVGGEKLADAMGMSVPGAGMAISAGMSIIGGMFEDDGKDQEEAQKKTKEANKLYDKNTDALNKLANNMSSLSGGIDGLNSSLVSSFSKIPTFGKLTDVTSTMKDMYSTMEKTRQFNEVAYQVTKTKKGKKGFMGIGASADTSWTETISVSVQSMLQKYGFKGAIEDMTTNQLRDFSTWLDDYDLGDSDNFSILAGALEDYAEALDKFDKNIDKFFYDTTMESFAGISSLNQEELRQQIEDFYKDLGFQIDDEMSKVIDDMAESMSVMVTIMQDVRGGFVESWRDSGKTAGGAFLSSMTPYIDAMLENISQVFYDVYFSDVTEILEGEFKNLSEALVELKKQGSELDWDSVGDSLSGSFDKVLSAIISAKNESTNFNDILLELQERALSAGLTLSELLELGLVSGTQKTVLDSFKEALNSTEADGALTSIGELVGNKVGDAMADKLIDNMLSDKVLQFSANIDKVLGGSMSFDSLSGLASEALSVGMMMEEQRKRLEAIKDMFNFDGTVSYDSQESNISYESGTSTSVVNHYYLNSTIEAGNVIESDSIERLADSLIDTLIEKLKVDRGIDIAKNY
ncbi:MAG: hypothetical protein ACRC6E_02440, partial [Fusobacteriaceae bacterium]